MSASLLKIYEDCPECRARKVFQYNEDKDLVEMPDNETAYEYQFKCLSCNCKVMVLEDWSRLEKFEVFDAERVEVMSLEDLQKAFRSKSKQFEWTIFPVEVMESINAIKSEIEKRRGF